MLFARGLLYELALQGAFAVALLLAGIYVERYLLKGDRPTTRR